MATYACDIRTRLPFAARNQDEHSPGSGLLRMSQYANRVLRSFTG
jgi:hypothetical protein